MPIKKTTVKGKTAYKYGATGKAYTGPNAKAKAAAQGRAIEASKHSKKK